MKYARAFVNILVFLMTAFVVLAGVGMMLTFLIY